MINDERCERYHDTQDVIMAQWKSFSGANDSQRIHILQVSQICGRYEQLPRYV